MGTALINTNFQEHIHKMNERELELLAYDIRDFLITEVARKGGHLASNLGIVELTIALHRAFDAGRDRIVWDIGHQCYTHEILTGRAQALGVLRDFGGHASAAISAAMGLAEARTLAKEDHQVVCVIGDGALAGGLAYEGLSNAGARGTKMLVVLNDNEMSISQGKGSMAKHLSRLRSSQAYQQAKQQFRERMQRIPRVGDGAFRRAERLKDIMRFAVVKGSLFEELGFTYFGPVDGHDIHEMVDLFEAVKLIDGPVLVHVVTKKGKGYRNAEKQPLRFRSIGPFDPLTGQELAQPGRTWAAAAGEAICALAEEDARVCAVSAAVTDGCGLGEFSRMFPGRMFDTGVAEGHAAAFAAGLASGGYRPFVFAYSTFLQRAYDEMLMDVCSKGLPVVFMVGRAGNAGTDGEAQHGVFDLSYFSTMPGMTTLAPACEEDLRAMMRYALSAEGPVAIRYPRGEVAACGGGAPSMVPLRLPGGEGADAWTAVDVEIRAAGRMAGTALAAAALLAAKGVRCGVVSERRVFPLNLEGEGGLLAAGSRCRLLVTLEDNAASGGFGEAVCAALFSVAGAPPVLRLSWPDAFLTQGTEQELFEAHGLDAPGAAGRIEEALTLL
ncbi:MAG: 1-deoxy-D-xylulose-5-phosphate synthase [Clostridiales Family XIII bacterium]|jgi:1-deoxy-D-xylulose-5-phosphate synthase|nr:1-deoxy-D-xylulose-5-phosphate synthase [Clostridiales Family XIII bacterium]